MYCDKTPWLKVGVLGVGIGYLKGFYKQVGLEKIELKDKNYQETWLRSKDYKKEESSKL